MQRHRFGRRAETLPEDQMLLGLEDVEKVAAYGEMAQDVSAAEGREVRARRCRGNRGAADAPAADRSRRRHRGQDLPCCEGALHRIVPPPAASAHCLSLDDGPIEKGSGGGTAFWKNLYEFLGFPELLEDPRFDTLCNRCGIGGGEYRISAN